MKGKKCFLPPPTPDGHRDSRTRRWRSTQVQNSAGKLPGRVEAAGQRIPVGKEKISPEKWPVNIFECSWNCVSRECLRGKYHCTVDLLFGISCMTTDNFWFYLLNRLIRTSQTGGQQYSDTSPFSIPWSILSLRAHLDGQFRFSATATVVIHASTNFYDATERVLLVLFALRHPRWPKQVHPLRPSRPFALTFLQANLANVNTS
jgi:hypothetical protein